MSRVIVAIANHADHVEKMAVFSTYELADEWVISLGDGWSGVFVGKEVDAPCQK